jgi:hypothetical protein
MTILVVLLRGNQARQKAKGLLYYLNINLEFAKNGLFYSGCQIYNAFVQSRSCYWTT